VAALVLLLVALLGPWTFDLIVVPAEYSCSPAVRLEGDYCGLPMSGTWLLAAAVSVPGRMVVELVSGAAVQSEPRELAVCLFLLLVLPFLSTLLLLPGRERRCRRVFHWTAWGLAGAFSIFWMAAGWQGAASMKLWGVWLYTGVAVATLAAEVLLASSRAAGETRQQTHVEGR
jgi:hypothetical protein